MKLAWQTGHLGQVEQVVQPAEGFLVDGIQCSAKFNGVANAGDLQQKGELYV
jgi:hypothetical protein